MNDARQKNVQEELLRLRNDLELQRRQYLEQTVIADHLRESHKQKDERIAELEMEIEQTNEHFELLQHIAAEEKRSSLASLTHDMKKVTIELDRMRDENTIMKGYELENVKLKSLISELKEQLIVMEHERSKERKEMIRDMDRFRQTLEEEFGRQLREAEERSRLRAVDDLSAEAAHALKTQKKMNSALAQQNEAMEGMLKRFSKLESDYHRMKTDRVVDEEQHRLQTSMYAQLKSKLHVTENRAQEMEDQIRQLQNERGSIELIVRECEAIKTERDQLRKRLKRAKDIIQKLRSGAGSRVSPSGCPAVPDEEAAAFDDREDLDVPSDGGDGRAGPVARSREEARMSANEDDADMLPSLPGASKMPSVRRETSRRGGPAPSAVSAADTISSSSPSPALRTAPVGRSVEERRREHTRLKMVREGQQALDSVWNSTLIHHPSVPAPVFVAPATGAAASPPGAEQSLNDTTMAQGDTSAADRPALRAGVGPGSSAPDALPIAVEVVLKDSQLSVMNKGSTRRWTRVQGNRRRLGQQQQQLSINVEGSAVSRFLLP